MDSERALKPNSPAQEEFLSLSDDISEAGFGGANGGGKTWALIAIPILRGFHHVKGFHGIIFRKTNKQLEESIEPRCKEFYMRQVGGWDYNHTTKYFTYRATGAKIKLSYLETLEHAKDHDTNEYNYCAFEELTHFEKDPYEYVAYSRVRSGRDSQLPALIRNAFTPGNIGHRWVYNKFIKAAPLGRKILVERQRIRDKWGELREITNRRIFIPAFGRDNPALSQEYLDGLYRLSESERRAKLEGDWNAFTGQVFSEFRIHPGTDEPDNACHVETPLENIPSYWPKIIAIDWGYRHATFVLFAAIDEFGVVHIYREMVFRETKISEWTAQVKRACQNEQNIVSRVIDPSAQQDRGQEVTIYQQVAEETGWNDLGLADNDRVGGKQLLHDFLRWAERPPRFDPKGGFDAERALYILRNDGGVAHDDYIRAFLPDREERVIPRLKISSNCPELIDVIQQCSYDEKKVEDVAKFDGDDGYDCLRYLLKEAHYYLTDAKKDYEQRIAIQKVVKELKSTQNWSRYYRQMEKLESSARKFLPAVRQENW